MVTQHPDVVVLDLMMPRMDGFELLNVILERNDITIPIIICSNIKEEDYIKKELYRKANLFIEKADYS